MKKIRQITVKMSEALYARLKLEAKRKDREAAWLARDFIKKALKFKEGDD